MIDHIKAWLAELLQSHSHDGTETEQITGSAISSTAWATTTEIVNAGGAESAGSDTTFARGGHRHALDLGAVSNLNGTAADGTSTSASHTDHTHGWTWATTTEIADVAAAEAAGTDTTVARGGHTHTIGSGVITNAMVSGSAAIAASKIATGTFGGGAVSTTLPQALYIDGSTTIFMRSKTISSLTNGSVAALLQDGGNGTATRCLVFITNDREDCALFITRGSWNATLEVADATGNYSNTAGTAASNNLYYSAGNVRYELQNNSGATRTYQVFYVAY